MSATLYIVATPIGNLADITLRAIEVLKKVDVIAAEDTRHSAHLLQHYSITTPMLAYHEHSSEGQTDKVLGLLQEGKDIALISDAGTPLISDPGYRLVKKAHALGITVVPVPGASALIAALSVSGLATDRFTYIGFLPAKAVARQETIKSLQDRQETLVFYEAPHRVAECVEDMRIILGDNRKMTIAREITKNFETIKQLSLAEMSAWIAADGNQQRGEIVLLLEGAVSRATDDSVLPQPALQLIDRLINELAPKVLSKIVAEHYDLPKKAVYEHILTIKKDGLRVL